MSEDISAADAASARSAQGRQWHERVTTIPPQEAESPLSIAVRDFVFSEVWSREALDMRSRRWISMTCVAYAGVEMPLTMHIYSALKSGDMTLAELREFALHFATYAGVPKATLVDRLVRESWERVTREGGPLQRT